MTRRPLGPAPAGRAGFSLIELLVVISIIVFVMGIAVGTFFRVRAGQQNSATDATLAKCNSLIERRVKAINDQVTDDAKNNHPGYAAVFGACGNADLAKAIWTYAKMKNELPMSFNEARTAVGVNVNGAVVWTLQPKAVFSPTVLPVGTAGGTPEESAVCLYLGVLTNAGGGTAIDSDGLQGQTGDVDIGGRTFKCFKDSWGTPIAFIRTAYNSEVAAPPFIHNGQSFDPFDPSLYNPTTRGKIAGWPARDAFWNSVKPNVTWAGATLSQNTYPGRVNHTWTAISAGPNKQWWGPRGTPGAATDVYGLPGLPDTDTAKDNHLSYRLRRQGNTGD